MCPCVSRAHTLVTSSLPAWSAGLDLAHCVQVYDLHTATWLAPHERLEASPLARPDVEQPTPREAIVKAEPGQFCFHFSEAEHGSTPLEEPLLGQDAAKVRTAAARLLSYALLPLLCTQAFPHACFVALESAN